MVRPLAAVALWIGVTGCAPWRADARAWAPEQATIAAELAVQVRAIVGEGEALDVGPLWEMTRTARIIGLGEGTHGTREFRQVMNAMVRRAAEDERPLVVALELDFNTGLALDAWVGDAWYSQDPGVRERSFAEVFGARWLYATEEFRALFTWIRAYNQSVAADRAIRVVGVDACLHPSCVSGVATYFDVVDPEYGDQARARLAMTRYLMAEYRASPAWTAEARAALAGLRTRLEDRRDLYVMKRGAAAHAAALRQIWLAERRLDAAVSEGGEPISGDRDWVMADTVGWISQQRPEARIVVIAHNGHTGKALDHLPNGRMQQGPVMGQEIARRFGAEYVAVHMTFDRGSFLAHHTRSTIGAARAQVGELQAFPVRPAPTGTLEATLRGPGPAYALDVRGAAVGEGALARYLRGWHSTRAYGYAWKRMFAVVPAAWEELVPAADFDVLVYFSRASATRPYVAEGPGGEIRRR